MVLLFLSVQVGIQSKVANRLVPCRILSELWLARAIAMVIGVQVSLGIAIFVSEMSSPKISTPLSFVIELLAAVPSIIYGLWALLVFRFWIVGLFEMPLYKASEGSIPFFAKTPFA
jgi:phosphate transport system permease protein